MALEDSWLELSGGKAPFSRQATDEEATGLRAASAQRYAEANPFVSTFAGTLKGTVAGGSLTALGNIAGSLGMRELSDSLYKSGDELQKTAAPYMAPQLDLRSVTDIGSGFDYAKAQMAQGLGSMVPAILGRRFGGAPAGYAGAYLPQHGENINRLRHDPATAGMSDAEMAGYALPASAGQAALDYLVPGGYVNKAARSVVKAPLARAGTTLGATMLVEGATEGGQEYIGQQMHGLANPNRDTSKDYEDILQSVVGGAIGGAPVGGLDAGIGYMSDRRGSKSDDTRSTFEKSMDLGAEAGESIGTPIGKLIRWMSGIRQSSEGDTTTKFSAQGAPITRQEKEFVAESISALGKKRQETEAWSNIIDTYLLPKHGRGTRQEKEELSREISAVLRDSDRYTNGVHYWRNKHEAVAKYISALGKKRQELEARLAAGEDVSAELAEVKAAENNAQLYKRRVASKTAYIDILKEAFGDNVDKVLDAIDEAKLIPRKKSSVEGASGTQIRDAVRGETEEQTDGVTGESDEAMDFTEADARGEGDWATRQMREIDNIADDRDGETVSLDDLDSWSVRKQDPWSGDELDRFNSEELKPEKVKRIQQNKYLQRNKNGDLELDDGIYLTRRTPIQDVDDATGEILGDLRKPEVFRTTARKLVEKAREQVQHHDYTHEAPSNPHAVMMDFLRGLSMLMHAGKFTDLQMMQRGKRAGTYSQPEWIPLTATNSQDVIDPVTKKYDAILAAVDKLPDNLELVSGVTLGDAKDALFNRLTNEGVERAAGKKEIADLKASGFTKKEAVKQAVATNNRLRNRSRDIRRNTAGDVTLSPKEMNYDDAYWEEARILEALSSPRMPPVARKHLKTRLENVRKRMQLLTELGYDRPRLGAVDTDSMPKNIRKEYAIKKHAMKADLDAANKTYNSSKTEIGRATSLRNIERIHEQMEEYEAKLRKRFGYKLIYDTPETKTYSMRVTEKRGVAARSPIHGPVMARRLVAVNGDETAIKAARSRARRLGGIVVTEERLNKDGGDKTDLYTYIEVPTDQTTLHGSTVAVQHDGLNVEHGTRETSFLPQELETFGTKVARDIPEDERTAGDNEAATLGERLYDTELGVTGTFQEPIHGRDVPRKRDSVGTMLSALEDQLEELKSNSQPASVALENKLREQKRAATRADKAQLEDDIRALRLVLMKNPRARVSKPVGHQTHIQNLERKIAAIKAASDIRSALDAAVSEVGLGVSAKKSHAEVDAQLRSSGADMRTRKEAQRNRDAYDARQKFLADLIDKFQSAAVVLLDKSEAIRKIAGQAISSFKKGENLDRFVEMANRFVHQAKLEARRNARRKADTVPEVDTALKHTLDTELEMINKLAPSDQIVKIISAIKNIRSGVTVSADYIAKVKAAARKFDEIYPAYGMQGAVRQALVERPADAAITESTQTNAPEAAFEPSKTPEFDKLPSFKEGQSNMVYAGIGSRETPKEVLDLMTKYAGRLAELGYTLNSGGAIGADSAFEAGAGDKKQIFYAKDATDQTRAVAREIHPAPDNLSRFPLNLMARNTNQLFGKNLDTPVDFVLAWTPDGAESTAERTRRTGGTGQAIDMASRKGIPVFNLAKADGRQRFEQFMKDKSGKKTESTQSKAPTQTMAMKFTDGTVYSGIRHTMRSEFAGKSTMDLIKSGDRTATTRNAKPDVKVGDVIKMEDGKGGSVNVVVTRDPYQLKWFENQSKNEANSEKWSKLEGWAPEVFEAYAKRGAWQFQYEVAADDAAHVESLIRDRSVDLDKADKSAVVWAAVEPAAETEGGKVIAAFSDMGQAQTVAEHYGANLENTTVGDLLGRSGSNVTTRHNKQRTTSDSSQRLIKGAFASIDAAKNSKSVSDGRANLLEALDLIARSGVSDQQKWVAYQKLNAVEKSLLERAIKDDEDFLADARKHEKTIRYNAMSTYIHNALGREGIAATHDSPIRHDGKFNWRKHLLKGEGHATFGAGTYLSTADGVHRSYKNQFTAQAARDDTNHTVDSISANQDIREWINRTIDTAVEEGVSTGVALKKAIISDLKRDYRNWSVGDEDGYVDNDLLSDILNAIDRAESTTNADYERLAKPRTNSPTYHVTVHAKPEELLDWNAPLSEQSELVKKALDKIGAVYQDAEGRDHFHTHGKAFKDQSITGEDIYKKITWVIGSQAKASDYLQSLGIVGHKYASSDGKNNEFPNYVIYDDSRIETNFVSFNKEYEDFLADARKHEKTIRYNAMSVDIHNALGREGIAAAHDSPIRHEGKFNWRKHLLRGEGHASFGAGTYLSTADGVHRSYKNQFTAQMIQKRYQNSSPGATALIIELDLGATASEAKSRVIEKLEQRLASGKLNSLQTKLAVRDIAAVKGLSESDVNSLRGGLTSPTYHVTVHVKPEELLDWDAPLSEQSELVKKAIAKSESPIAVWKESKSNPYADDDTYNAWEAGEPDYNSEPTHSTHFEVDGEILEAVIIDGRYGVKLVINGLAGDSEHYSNDTFDTVKDAKDHLSNVVAAKDGRYKMFQVGFGDITNGRTIYETIAEELGTQAKASDYLQSLGIVGHKYASSDGKDNKFPNYVIYDDSRIETNYVSFNKESVSREPLTQEERAEIEEWLAMVAPQAVVQFVDDIGGASGSWELDNNTGRVVIKLAIYASQPYTTAYHEAIHDLFHRLRMTGHAEAIRVMEKVATMPAIKKRLAMLLDGEDAAIAQLDDPEEAAAYLFQFYTAGVMGELGEKTDNWFHKLWNAIKNVMGWLNTQDKAVLLMKAFYDGKLADPVTSKDIMGRVEADAGRLDSLVKPAMVLAEKLSNTAASRLRESNDPFLTELMNLFEPDVTGKRKSTLRNGEEDNIGYFNAQWQMKNKGMAKLEAIFEGTTAEERAEALEYLQKAAPLSDIPSGPARHIVRNIRNLLQKYYSYLHDAGVTDFGGVPIREIKDNYFPRHWNFDMLLENGSEFVDDLLATHADVLQKIADRATEAAREEQANSLEDGETAAYASQIYTKEDVAKTILGNLVHRMGSEEPSPGEHAAGKTAISESISRMGFTPLMVAANERSLKFLDMEVFSKYLEKDIVKSMSVYVSQAVKRAEYTRRFGPTGERIREHLDGAARQKWNELASAKYDTKFRAAYSNAIHAPADKSKDAIQKLEKQYPGFQEAVKEFDAAYDKHFAEYAKVVQALEGTLGRDITPNLRKVNSWIMTYQSIRTLGLSLITSWTDPLGIVMRGGDANHAYKAFVRGMKEVYRTWKNSPTGSEDADVAMAKQIGTLEASAAMDALGQMYSSVYFSGGAKRVNDAFFKLNGMEAWNRAMRVQATVAAIDWMKDAMTSDAPHILRQLEELGLQKSDLKLNDDGELIMPHKVQNAIVTWVNTAILRPNASQRPVWASNPKTALFFHLMQFTYSMQSILLKRARYEASNGNFAPAAVLVFGYVPMTIAAMVVKGLIQGGGDEPEWMKSMTLSDWLVEGTMRSGILGIPGSVWDTNMQSDILPGDTPTMLKPLDAVVGTMLPMPAIDQLLDIVSPASTDTTKDTLLKALPLQVIYRHWFD